MTTLVQKNYHAYREMILSFIPSEVIVTSTKEVENKFPDSVDEKKRGIALF